MLVESATLEVGFVSDGMTMSMVAIAVVYESKNPETALVTGPSWYGESRCRPITSPSSSPDARVMFDCILV